MSVLEQQPQIMILLREIVKKILDSLYRMKRMEKMPGVMWEIKQCL
jgi:hypothetical protein